MKHCSSTAAAGQSVDLALTEKLKDVYT